MGVDGMIGKVWAELAALKFTGTSAYRYCDQDKVCVTKSEASFEIDVADP